MHNKSLYIILFFSLFTSINAFAQSSSNLTVIADEMLDSIIQSSAEASIKNPGMQGYRIQIYSNSDRKMANEIRTKCLQLYPDIDVHLIYQQPSFKVRVGDFRNRIEAYPVYRDLLKSFDNVLIVPDRINLPKLIEITQE
jgi:hypothetical protein